MATLKYSWKVERTCKSLWFFLAGFEQYFKVSGTSKIILVAPGKEKNL